MRRILVLDDEPAVLNALRRTLRSAFPKDAVTIETFDDPEAAVLRAAEQDFDVVISDYRMPGLNGADVLQLVKGLQPDTIRIVVSATTEFVDIMAAVNRAEIFRYMTKPWDQEELVATVGEAFERRDSLVQSRQGMSPAQTAQAQAAQEPLTQDQRELQQLEQEEPGITHVNWDEHGNIRLF